MLSRNHPDRIQITFDDRRLVANAGLLLPATLARHLGLPELVQQRLDLGDAPGRANAGDKMMTLVASALAGGDCIDDADVLRTGGTACTLGGTVKAPSTLGTFLRSFRWGHVRQLDRVSRELLARAWAAGAGPGDAPFTIDLDSTICETYGLAKEGARHHGYTGKRGYHPLLAIAAGTGDVLMSRLREGRANTARGAAHFLRETVSRVRRAGASGQLTARADSGFYAHALVAACREMDVRFSITIRQHKSLRNLIEAIPDADWNRPRNSPTGSLFATYSYHGFITDRDGETLELEADHRRHAEIENAMVSNLGSILTASVWASRSRPPRPFGDGSSPWPDGSPARHAASPCICHSAGLGKPSSVAPWHGCERFHSQPDGARPQLTRHPPNRTSPQTRASPVREHLSPRPLPAISPCPTSPDGHKVSLRRLKTDTGPIYQNRARTIASLCPSSPILLLQRHTFGGFGLKLCSRVSTKACSQNNRTVSQAGCPSYLVV